ncbi:MAG: DUF2339 domain-containing protein [Desulfuromusa sp.]|nr:DUF2339 domain-containing protein [Desulfuromusa sp.]
MGVEKYSFERQIQELNEQVRQLNQRVTQLESSMTEEAVAKSIQLSRQPVQQPAKEDMLPTGASLLVGSSSLLQHISAVCFLLVAALGLRALTDNGLLELEVGTALGIGYAAALIIGGYLLYRKNKSMAPIFTTTGSLLMFSVLVETYTRFASLPDELVYIMLAVTGIGMAVISYINKAAVPIIIGTLGMCAAAVVIDYPNPYFPYLGLLLWISNILGFFATRLKRCSWLRWLLLFTTHFMLQIWGLKLSGLMNHGGSAEHLSPNWFIPIITLIGATFVMISLFGIIRSGDEKISKFDFSLPVINAGWCYVAGIYALKDPTLFGAPAAAAAIVHFALAYWLSRRQTSNAQGTNTFMAGGLILACLSLPALLGNIFLPLPILSVLAIATCYFSYRWSSGGMRITSYLLQVYVSVIFSIEFIGGIDDQQRSPAILIVVLICSMIALGHYYYARRTKPPERSQIFSHYDKRDQSALLPLFSGLTNSFFTCMLLAYYALQHYYQEDMTFALIGTQSIIINLAAIFIMIRAFFNDNTELRNVAILVLVIGGSKVFIIDLFRISGAWLVCSIFTFGIAAALASLVLARWRTGPSDQRQQSEPVINEPEIEG